MNLRAIKMLVYVLGVLIVLALCGVVYGVYLKIVERNSADQAVARNTPVAVGEPAVPGAAPAIRTTTVNSLILPAGCTNATIVQDAALTQIQFTGPECTASYVIDATGGRWDAPSSQQTAQ